MFWGFKVRVVGVVVLDLIPIGPDPKFRCWGLGVWKFRDLGLTFVLVKGIGLQCLELSSGFKG